MKINLNYVLTVAIGSLALICASCGSNTKVEPATIMVPIAQNKADDTLYTGGEQEHLLIAKTKPIGWVDCDGDSVHSEKGYGEDTTVTLQGEPTTPRKVLGLSPDDKLFVEKADAKKEMTPIATRPVAKPAASAAEETEAPKDNLWPFFWKYILPILVAIALAGMLYKFLATPWGPSRRSEQTRNDTDEQGARRGFPHGLIIVERPAERSPSRQIAYSAKEGEKELKFTATGVEYPFQVTIQTEKDKAPMTLTFGPPPDQPVSGDIPA